MTSISPDAALTLNGIALLQTGNLREADAMLRCAFALDDRDAQALLGLGIIAHRTGNFATALEFFGRAIAIDYALAAAHVNRGISLAALHRHVEAIAAFELALSISPDLPSSLINMATSLHTLGRLDEGVLTLERARRVQSDSAELHNNLGNFYKDQGRLAEALACYERALELNPMMQQAFSNKLAALKLDSSLTPSQILAKHREWSNWFEAESTSAPLLVNSPVPSRRLRIGYVSPDCHTAVPAFLDAVVALHDREQFDVFCYFNNTQEHGKLKVLGVLDTSRVLRGMGDQDVALLINADAIDILVDIAGHTGHNRLSVFARRPAPVQITWLDYLCTTGIAAMDYRITDIIADPLGNEEFHSEKLLRLPHSQWCWQADAAAPAVSALPLKERGHVTFGSFNNAQKLTEATLTLWGQLLEKVPDAHLRIAGIPEGFARRRVLDGLACSPFRVSFLPRVSLVDYRAAFADVDIALDPSPFSGATTTLDALRQGVPVLTLPGARSCSRSTASLLTTFGLTDWIAVDEEDFLERAKRFACETSRLAALRSSLRARLRASPVMDHAGFTRELEDIYRKAWHAWCDQRTSIDCRPDTLCGSDNALQEIRRALDTQRHDDALALLTPVLNVRPHWELAKREMVRACLAWGRANPCVAAAWRSAFVPIDRPTKISAVICSVRPDRFTALKNRLSTGFAGHAFEVIGIHDAKSLCEGYNRGAAKANGEILIFCHDDIDIPLVDFGERVLRHLADHDVIGVVGASKLVDGGWDHAGPPHIHGQIIHRPPGEIGNIYFAAGLQRVLIEGVQALDGVFMAMHRRVWEIVRFDDVAFNGFHLYDIDFTWRAHLAGFRLAVPLDLLLIHFSAGRYDLQWQPFNVRFLRKFPELPNMPSRFRYGSLHVKLERLEQVERLHAGLLHHCFGAYSVAP